MVSTGVFVVLLAAIGCSNAGLFDGNAWNGLTVKWSPFGPLGGFYRMPRLAKEARAQGYTVPPEEVNSNNTDIQILCPDKDPTVCLLFDKQGYIAGIEMGVVRAQVDNKEYPYEKHHMFTPKKRFGYEIYGTQLFFVEQAVLNGGGRTSLSPAGTGTGLWLRDGPDPLFEIPRLEKNIRTTAYTKENCIPTMGTHYYYNISASMNCEDFHPIFGLYRKGELLGFGYQILGKVNQLGKMIWFEDVPPFAIKPTIPNAPACLVDRATKYGVVSLHVYFVDYPYLISC